MVPIKEMTDVMRVVKEKVRLKEGTWVRMKRGVFKDDLAQIDFVEPSEHKIRLKLIPRIDFTRMRGVMRNQNAVSGQNTSLIYQALYTVVNVRILTDLSCMPLVMVSSLASTLTSIYMQLASLMSELW